MTTRPQKYANAKYRKLRRLENPDWQWYQPIETARELIERQMEKHNLSHFALARAAGLHTSVIWKVKTGQSRYVYPSTIEKLRTLPNLPQESVYLISSAATKIRIHCMAAAGWSAKRHLPREVYVKSDTCTRPFVEEMIEWLDEFAYRDGPSPHCRAYARGKGWKRAEEYDQDLLHDPLWDGKGGLLSRGLSSAEKAAEAKFLSSFGLSNGEIAARLGVTSDYVSNLVKKAS